ncbi:type II secretion system minor pseudopilin GspK [Orrella dioscoreae]|uniref:Type II secretion system protein K n=1 Tax=Orrella dioscoreae TaxID=1851544 RepID=A0A1C3K5G6_9BURK|nr:type II secretion system minor pseudopilin GspK [Orrella dioscoreae]SBT26684.1 General secretion pathway protein K [Orrella dioscoreae]SOE49411.1 General secretion pathway protein K [Orrella dioscoreae]
MKRLRSHLPSFARAPGPVPVPVPVAARQAGMAVISALLVVATVSLIAAGMIDRQATRVRTLESEQARVQARWLLSGGMDWARATLRGEARRSSVTHNGQLWATPITDLRISEEGAARQAVFSGRAEDEQGKFNLQNLARDGQVLPEQVQALSRLLQSLRLPAELAPRIAERMARAQSRPASSRTDGESGAAQTDGDAESGTDTGTPSPSGGRAGTALAPGLRSIDDLRGMRGLDESALTALTPYLTVLPARTAINVNTAPAEVLATLSPALSLSLAMSVADQRDRGQTFNNRADFINRLANPEIEIGSDAVAVDSDWFAVFGTVRLDRATVDMRALLQRDGQNMPRVIWMMEVL